MGDIYGNVTYKRINKISINGTPAQLGGYDEEITVNFTSWNKDVSIASDKISQVIAGAIDIKTVSIGDTFLLDTGAYLKIDDARYGQFQVALYDSSNNKIGDFGTQSLSTFQSQYFCYWTLAQYSDSSNTYISGAMIWSDDNVTGTMRCFQPTTSWQSYLGVNILSDDLIGTGGGATHIAKVTGQLKDLSSNLSDILIVAGGGGGGLVAEGTPTAGANGGGISGSGSNSANQSTGYAFGQGEASGGGGGLYGGYKAANGNSGGAGSGYIGNSLLSNKKMVGYNVPTSSAESTKTESVQVYSATAEANKPKAGNGFVRITFKKGIDTINMQTILQVVDPSHIIDKRSKNAFMDTYWNEIVDYVETDYILAGIQSYAPIVSINSSKTEISCAPKASGDVNVAMYDYIPIPNMVIKNFSFDYKCDPSPSPYEGGMTFSNIQKQVTANENRCNTWATFDNRDNEWHTITTQIDDGNTYNYLLFNSPGHAVEIKNLVIEGALM